MSPDTATYQPPYGDERATFIRDAEAQAAEAFYRWIARCQPHTRFSMPDAAVHYFISPRAYEIAEDPTKVALRIVEKGPNYLDFIIVEEMPYELTNIVSLLEFERLKREDSYMRGKGYAVPIRPIPEDVHDAHAEAFDNIQAGKLLLTDKVLAGFYLTYHQAILEVGSYTDSSVSRHKRLGRAQYARLRECARSFGFHAIVGANEAHNLSFFTDVLGRMLWRDIPEELRNEIARSYPEYDEQPRDIDPPKPFTVDVL